MSFPKVSIIIPIFNPGEYFKKCLDSVVNQTLKEIEIICIDDGSDDGSLDILESYAKNDSRFNILHQQNSGAGAARNKGIENSNGEFILFLDSDDWIENDICEKLYNHASNLDVDLVLFDVIWYFKNSNEMISYFEENEFNEDYKTFVFNQDFIRNKIMEPSLGVIWSKFYKSSFIKQNNIKFSTYKIYNDVVFHFKTILSANKIAYLPKIGYHYIKVGQPSLQSSFRWGKYEPIWFDVMMEVREFLIKNDLMYDFRREFVNYSFLSFITKFGGIKEEYKEVFYSKIKYFYESLKLTKDELEILPFDYLTFYIHIINSNSYDDFKLMHDAFDGKRFI